MASARLMPPSRHKVNGAARAPPGDYVFSNLSPAVAFAGLRGIPREIGITLSSADSSLLGALVLGQRRQLFGPLGTLLREKQTDRLRLRAACIVKLALLVDVLEVERISIGLIRWSRAVPNYNHASAHRVKR